MRILFLPCFYTSASKKAADDDGTYFGRRAAAKERIQVMDGAERGRCRVRKYGKEVEALRRHARTQQKRSSRCEVEIGNGLVQMRGEMGDDSGDFVARMDAVLKS